MAWSPRRMAALTSAPDLASRPLVVWLGREFESRGRFAGWESRMRPGRAASFVYQGRQVNGSDITLELPPIGDDAVARIALVDLDED